MRQNIKKITQRMLFVSALVFGMGFVFTPVVGAADCLDPNTNKPILSLDGGANCAQGNNTPSGLFELGPNGEPSLFTTIVNIMLFIIGAIAVIMIIVGGIRYVVSGGDQNAVTSAKNTIMYAVVGLIIAALAYAVVNFVITGLTPK